MRVYIDSTNKAKYDELFALIGEATGNTVDNLPSYFEALEKVKDESQLNKFFRIPLDEPCFTINLSTRVITVPRDFTSYGLGVQGDAYAEVVFFESDRYFDQVDLASTECWIQWSTAKKKGNSKSVYVDVTEDKMLFGWAITEDMTESATTIDFAVRWFTRDADNNKVTYSLSTQKASCAIKSSLNLDVVAPDMQPDLDIENILRNRPKYSGIINSLDGAAATITTNLENGIYNLRAPETDDEQTAYDVAALELGDLADDNGDHDGIYPLTIVATAPSTTGEKTYTITYQWYNGSTKLNGEENASYTAYKAGNYYVKIGCAEVGGKAGTRYINSNTVEIPAAEEIEFENPSIQSYLWCFKDGDDSGVNPTIKYPIKGTPEGKITYALYKGENKIVQDAAEYTLTGDFEGDIYFSAQNRLNNTVSTEIKTTTAHVRRAPVAPPCPTISLENTTLIATIDTDKLDEISKTWAEKEFYYTWTIMESESQKVIQTSEAGHEIDINQLLTRGDHYYSVTCVCIHKVIHGVDTKQKTSPLAVKSLTVSDGKITVS